MSNPRRSKGRQKIEMKRMTNESNLQVTFSKRRNGLFKKASELCTLCGVDLAVVVFSPTKKVFSFGNPSVEAVIDRYLTGAPPPNNTGTMHYIEAHRSANVRELNAQITQINAQLDIEKKCSEELNRLHKETQAQCWWASPIDQMNRAQLDELKLSLEKLKKNVSNLADKFVIQSATLNPTNQFFGGASSSNALPQLPPQLLFPPPQMIQNPVMLQGHHHGFNNVRGYGPPGFF